MARSKTRRAVLAVVVIAPLLAACNAILGISDFEKAECSGGGACFDEGGSTDRYIPPGFDGGDAGVDGNVTPVEAGGTAAVSWVKFRMPNYAQAGVPDASVPKYDPTTATDAGAVQDSVSKLVWRPVTAGEKDKSYSFKDATALCAAAKGGTWRLPTRIELVTLLDFNHANPTADMVFNLAADKKYWTTSFYRDTKGPNGAVRQTTQHLLVGFDNAPSNIINVAEETGGTAGAICIQAQ